MRETLLGVMVGLLIGSGYIAVGANGFFTLKHFHAIHESLVSR